MPSGGFHGHKEYLKYVKYVKHKKISNFFCFLLLFFSDDKLDRMSSRVLTELENIDDEAENKDIVMVKVDIDLDDKHILEKLGIPNNLPKLALFEEDQPAQLFEGMHLLSDIYFT